MALFTNIHSKGTTTVLDSNLPGETPAESPGNRRKRAHPRTVAVLFLACLAVMAAKTASAKAEAGDSYNDGLKVACQLFDSGYTGPQVVAELKKSFSSFESQIVGVGGKPGDHTGFVKLAVAEKCLQHLAAVK